jgi:hypothetical protein
MICFIYFCLSAYYYFQLIFIAFWIPVFTGMTEEGSVIFCLPFCHFEPQSVAAISEKHKTTTLLFHSCKKVQCLFSLLLPQPNDKFQSKRISPKFRHSRVGGNPKRKNVILYVRSEIMRQFYLFRHCESQSDEAMK